MCLAINDSYQLNTSGYLPLDDLRLVTEDGEVLNELGMIGEVRAPEGPPPSDGYDSEDYSFEDVEGRDITWKELIEGLAYTNWQLLEAGTSISETSRTYALHINRAFGLHKVRATRWLCSDKTGQLVCLCREGVFMFGAEFEFGCLVARGRSQALGFLLGGSISGREGPARAAGEPYDFYGEDQIGEDQLGDGSDADESDEDEFDFEPVPISITLHRGSGVRF